MIDTTIFGRERRPNLARMGFSINSWTRQAKITDAVTPNAMIASAGMGNLIQSGRRGVMMNVCVR